MLEALKVSPALGTPQAQEQERDELCCSPHAGTFHSVAKNAFACSVPSLKKCNTRISCKR